MKKLWVFSFCAFAFPFFTTCCAQDSTKHPHKANSLSIVFGQGRPLGSFDFNNANSNSPLTQSKGYAHGNSFADPGGLFNAELGIPIKKSSFGFIVHFGYNGNGFDNNRFHNLYTPSENYWYSNGATYNLSSSSIYTTLTLLPGISYTHNVGRFFFEIKVLAGPLLCAGPGISYSQVTPYNIEPFQGMLIPTSAVTQDSITTKSDLSLCIEAGIELYYRFYKTVSILIGCDYLYAEPIIPVTTKIYFDDGGQLSYNQMESTQNFKQKIPIELLNIYAGFEFSL